MQWASARLARLQVLCKYLLIDDNEGFISSVAKLFFQVDDFLNAIFDKLPFRLDKLLTLFGRFVKEARIYFTIYRKKNNQGTFEQYSQKQYHTFSRILEKRYM